MSVTSSSPAAAAAATANNVEKKNRPQEGGPTALFDQLLQAATAPAETALAAVDDALAQAQALAQAALDKALQEPAVDAEAAQAALLASGDLTAQMHSLVGQTRRLDTAVERAVRDGSSVPSALPAALAGTAAQGTLGAGTVPIVALGVQPVGENVAATQAVVLDAQTTQLEQAAQDAQDAAALPVPAAEHKEDGPIALQGAWQMVQPGAAASAQALLDQVGQWAAQWLGAAAAPGQRPAAQTAQGQGQDALHPLGQHAATGTRLLEQAVQASTASQQAQGETAHDGAPESTPQEDLRFWLQGQQQRGEVTLQHEGQALKVRVQLTGEQAHVVFRTDQADMRQLLDGGLAQLGDLLAQQGLALVDAQVQPDAGQAGGRPSDADDSRTGWGRAQQARVAVAQPDAALPAQRSTAAGRLNVYA